MRFRGDTIEISQKQEPCAPYRVVTAQRFLPVDPGQGTECCGDTDMLVHEID